MGMPITLAQVEEAQRNIAPVALRTPLVRCNTDTPANLYLKLENLQPIGSFKVRGAANIMARTPRERLARGVLTASAANMGQGGADGRAGDQSSCCRLAADFRYPVLSGSRRHLHPRF